MQHQATVVVTAAAWAPPVRARSRGDASDFQTAKEHAAECAIARIETGKLNAIVVRDFERARAAAAKALAGGDRHQRLAVSLRR